jgi:hypothetical protein
MTNKRTSCRRSAFTPAGRRAAHATQKGDVFRRVIARGYRDPNAVLSGLRTRLESLGIQPASNSLP